VLGDYSTAMTDFDNARVQELLARPNFAVISTTNPDGTITSTVVWQDTRDGKLAVNSALGRRWPTNLKRDPRATVVVVDSGNPYTFVEIRGTAEGTTDGADAHIDALAKKYLGQDSYPFRRTGEQRITYTIVPEQVRFVAQ
jgi:PPOX class probable F420-dependent enzyme